MDMKQPVNKRRVIPSAKYREYQQDLLLRPRDLKRTEAKSTAMAAKATDAVSKKLSSRRNVKKHPESPKREARADVRKRKMEDEGDDTGRRVRGRSSRFTGHGNEEAMADDLRKGKVQKGRGRGGGKVGRPRKEVMIEPQGRARNEGKRNGVEEVQAREPSKRVAERNARIVAGEMKGKEEPEIPVLRVKASKKEIMDDFLQMSGRKLPLRPKQKPGLVSKFFALGTRLGRINWHKSY